MKVKCECIVQNSPNLQTLILKHLSMYHTIQYNFTIYTICTIVLYDLEATIIRPYDMDLFVHYCVSYDIDNYANWYFVVKFINFCLLSNFS